MTRIPRVSKARLVKLQKELVTDSAIGEALGITRQAVHQWRKKLGVAPTTSDNSARNAGIIGAYGAGEAGTAIAKKFKLSISQTYRVINSAKTGARVPAKRAAKKKGK